MKNILYILFYFILYTESSLANDVQASEVSKKIAAQKVYEYYVDLNNKHEKINLEASTNFDIKYFLESTVFRVSSSWDNQASYTHEVSLENAIKEGIYSKVFYCKGQVVKEETFIGDEMTVRMYYDKEGRIIKRISYLSEVPNFILKKFNKNKTVDIVNCSGYRKNCLVNTLTKEQDALLYDEYVGIEKDVKERIKPSVMLLKREVWVDKRIANIGVSCYLK